jgi:hypothetical protein
MSHQIQECFESHYLAGFCYLAQLYVVVSTGRMTTRLLLGTATMFHHHELMAKVFKLHQDA